jgi:uncharacterized protein involved in exopolysaccharide biosynthesis
VSPRRIDAPETAALMADTVGLTQQEAEGLERDLAKVARAYGRAQTRVRTLRARLKKAEQELRERRREMRTLISVRRK